MDTTVTISLKTALVLDKICKANKCTKKEFLSAALLYFEKYGINPLTHESPAQEMQKLIKRVDQVIAFVRQQEKEILRPACEAIFSSEERIILSLNDIPSRQDIKEKFLFISSSIRETQNTITHTKHSQEEGFKLLARLVDAKEKTNVFSDLAKAYNKS